MGRWSRPVASAVLDCLSLPPGQAWLDVGCGTGDLTQVILNATDPQEVLGVDPSADFLATATKDASDPRVAFAVGDARDLPVQDNAYDVVIAGLVLHFVPDPGRAVREMTRAARSGGTVAAYVWDFAGERQFTGYFWQAAKALDPTAASLDPNVLCTVCQQEELGATFEGADLAAVTVQSIVTPIVFRNFDDYWQPHLLQGSSPAQRHVVSLDAKQQSALREQLLETMPFVDDGSLPLLGRLWVARGTKAA
jgi:SAM-dependent methyltransferase